MTEPNDPALSGLSYPAAKDVNGALHWASDAPARQPYQCIGCDSPMILRGGTRRKHFAHKPGSHCTAPETALHRLAKQTILEVFSDAARSGATYPLTFHCAYCRGEHEQNLVNRATLITSETRTQEGIIPDLSLFGENGSLLAAIEIVVTHLPSSETQSVYEKLGIPVLLVFPEWQSVEQLRKRVYSEVLINCSSICPEWKKHLEESEYARRNSLETVPKQFDHEHKCPTCAAQLEVIRADLYSDHPCYRCSASNRVAFFSSLWNEFPGGELLTALLSSFEVRYEHTYSATAKSTYMMNRCRECSAKFGDYFLHSDILTAPVHEERELGYCQNCSRWYPGGCEFKGYENPSVSDQVQSMRYRKKSQPPPRKFTKESGKPSAEADPEADPLDHFRRLFAEQDKLKH